MRFQRLVSLCSVMIGLWAGTGALLAHGDDHHEKCKKGYVMTDDHKCIRKR